MKKKSVSGILTSNQMILLYIIVVLCVLIGTRNQAFLSVSTAITLCRAMLVTLCFAVCEMLVIISGGIDVSFPAIACAALFIPIKIMTTQIWTACLWPLAWRSSSG